MYIQQAFLITQNAISELKKEIGSTRYYKKVERRVLKVKPTKKKAKKTIMPRTKLYL